MKRSLPRFMSVNRRRGGLRGGFTLLEAALVTVIVGVGCVATLQLLAAGSMANGGASELTTGLNLANNIRELMQPLAFADPTTPTHWGPESGESAATYDDIDDFDGRTFCPPLDARRGSLTSFDGWSQSVVVRTVDPDRLTLAVPNGSQPAARITVTVSRSGREVCRTSWLAMQPRQ